MRMLLVLMLPLILSCDSGEINRNGFYNYSEAHNCWRLPLLEPYELLSPYDKKNWGFVSKLGLKGVHWLSKVGVKDSIIVLYTKQEFSYSSDHPELWVVVNAKKRTEEIFSTNKDYKKCLRMAGVNDVSLHEINEVYEKFDKENVLPVDWQNLRRNRRGDD
jgi:hypothetical protein